MMFLWRRRFQGEANAAVDYVQQYTVVAKALRWSISVGRE